MTNLERLLQDCEEQLYKENGFKLAGVSVTYSEVEDIEMRAYYLQAGHHDRLIKPVGAVKQVLTKYLGGIYNGQHI